MKKGLTLILMLALCIGVCIFAVGCGNEQGDGDDTRDTASSYDEYGFDYHSMEDGYVAIGFNAVVDQSIKVTLPSEHNGKPVIGIAGGLFDKYCSNITTITLSENLKYIGDRAFAGCDKLVSVTLPSTVVSIGEGAFRGCTSLRTVNIPASVTTIEPYTFYGCASLGRPAQGASTSGSLSIEGDITYVGTGAFDGCTALSSIALSDKLTYVGENAFRGTGATRSEGGLVYFDIKNGAEVIGSWLIGTSEDIAAVNIAGGTVGIAAGAVKDVYAESITVPASVKFIPTGAFSDLGALSSISVDAANESYTSEGNCLIEKATNTVILGSSASVIPDGVAAIGEGAFRGLSALESIIIPDSVTSIGAYAFFDCAALGRGEAVVSVGSGISTLPAGVFGGCISLNSLTLPADITLIGEGAFSGCTSLTEISIPDAVTSIGARSFYGCTSLASVSVGSGTATIGASAFHGCSALTSVSLSANSLLAYIGESAFANCSSLKSFSMPSTVTTLEIGAFRYCTSLTSVTFSSSLASIGKECFKNCTKLSSISLPSSLSEIPESCFESCTSVKEIEIPEGIVSIGEAAFSKCTSLKSVIIPVSMVSMVKNDTGVAGSFSSTNLVYIYYRGTAESWETNDLNSSVSEISTGRVYFYTEEQPEGKMDPADGNTMPAPWYWHTVDGKPTVWAEK